MPQPIHHWFYLAALVALWGTSFMFISLALQGFTPLGVVALRVFLAAVVLVLVMYAKGLRLPKDVYSWALFALFAALGNVIPFYLISVGQQSVSSGISGLLMAVMPLITMILAHYWIAGETLNRFKLLGFSLGISGVALIIVPGLSLGGDWAFGAMLILLAAMCYAVNTIFVKRLSRMPALVVGAGIMVVASLVMLPIWLWQEQPWSQQVEVLPLVSVMWLGVGPTGLATLLYFAVIDKAGPTFLANINYLIPVVAYFVGALVLGESIEWWSLFALVMILCGIMLTRIRVGV